MENLFKQCDAIIITSPSNLFYFTGYSNEDAVVVLCQKEKFYITDKRCTEEATETLCGWSIVDTGANSYIGTALNLIKNLNFVNIGYEEENIKYTTFLEIEENKQSNQKLIDVSNEISLMRSIKTEAELAIIKEAQAITDKVFAEVLKEVKVGMSEIELASILNSLIYRCGATLAFDSIVAFGANTSKPHAHPSDKKLEQNDVVLIDFGAKYKGYCSDMTRSFAVGSVTEEYSTMYNHVLSAQRIALAGIKAGLTGAECDKLSRDYFAKHGLDKFFTHSLGHSLGIDIHENPNFSPRCNDVILENSILSVEPGLYFEGKFGIRIEDIVFIKKNAVENLTNSLKTLIIV